MSNQNGSPQQQPYSSSSLRPSGFYALINDFSYQIKLGIIGITILIIFFNDLYSLGLQALATDYYNYVLVIPFMMAYIIYRKRRILAAIMPLKDDGGRGYLNLVFGICGLFSSLMVYVYGIYTTDPLSYHLLSLEIFLASSILLLFNRQTLRTLAVPILLINAALPAAVTFGLSYWYGVSLYSIYPAYLFLKFVGLNVSIVPGNLAAPTIQLVGPAYSGQFQVGVASSGIYSFVGFTVFALFVAYIAAGPTWKKVLLFLLGYALLIPINALRETILITAANFWGYGAFEIFHLTSGIVLITIVTFVLLVIGDKYLHLDYFRPLKVKTPCGYCADESLTKSFCSNCGKFLKSLRPIFSTRDLLSVEAIILIFLLFFAAASPTFVNAKSYPQVNIALLASGTPANSGTPPTPFEIGNASQLLPNNASGYALSYQGDYTQEQAPLEADAVLDYQYTANNGSYFTVWLQVLTAYHTPQDSLISHIITYGLKTVPIYNNTNLEIPVNGSFVPVAGNFIVFLETEYNINVPWAILWWNVEAYVNLGSQGSQYRNVQIWLMDQNLPNHNSTELNLVGHQLLRIASIVATSWKTELPYSVLQVTLKQSSLPLAGVVMLPAAVIAGNDSLKVARVRKSNRKNIARLKSEDERQLLDAIDSIRTNNHIARGSLADILDAYTNLTGKKLTLTEAEIAMTYLEHLGFVKRKIIDNADEPVQIWQSLVPNANHDISMKEKLANVVRS